LQVNSQALQYRWTNDAGQFVSDQKNPRLQPTRTTQYFVTANLGKCEDKDNVRIVTIPYPSVNAGMDTSICFGNAVMLNAKIVGSSFRWSPSLNMIQSNTLTPLITPASSKTYYLTVSDTLGCNKSVTDSVQIAVIPKPLVFAGRDTAVSINQPLQLNATGATNYRWTPSTGLSDAGIANPVAIFNNGIDSILYRVRGSNGICFGEDSIKVMIFQNGPDLYIPSAFTPNADGRNDILKPIPVGIAQLNYFALYNRWGQLIYKTSAIGAGWDGNYNGEPQPAGTYIFQAEAKDITGKTIYKKGTAVLIR